MVSHGLKDIVIPNFDLTGKVAVITGGTKGLGYGIAVTFAHYGADVVVASRTAADCERVSGELRSLGVRSLGVPTDVTNSSQVESLMETAVKEFGKIDILVASAGEGATGPALELSEEDWDRVLSIDLKGVWLSDRAAARHMTKQGFGKIINLASSAGTKGSVNMSPYCAAKAGVINLTKELALEWGRYGVTVNCLCPAYVWTSISAEKLKDPKIYDKIVKRTILRRVGKIEEIAAAALYLASDFSGYMTGAQLLIDGGGGAF